MTLHIIFHNHFMMQVLYTNIPIINIFADEESGAQRNFFDIHIQCLVRSKIQNQICQVEESRNSTFSHQATLLPRNCCVVKGNMQHPTLLLKDSPRYFLAQLWTLHHPLISGRTLPPCCQDPRACGRGETRKKKSHNVNKTSKLVPQNGPLSFCLGRFNIDVVLVQVF